MGPVTSWTACGLILAVTVMWATPVMWASPLSSDCPPACLCVNSSQVNATSVTCSHGNLSLVPNVSADAQYLDLSGNTIAHIGQHLTLLDNLEVLDLSFNSLTSIQNGVFDGLKTLLTLDLSNNAITSIQPKVFTDLQSLQELNMAGNNLTILDNETFTGLTSLKILYLSVNTISEIDQGLFLTLENLLVLDISHNNLTEIHFDCFEGLGMLEELSIQHNSIAYIGNNTFLPLTNLRSLDLSYNVLVALKPSTFSGMASLASLSLTGNIIQAIEPGFMGTSCQLSSLSLGENQLANLSIPAFRGLARLEELNLNKMPSLTNVAFNAFHGLPALATLDLSHNPSLSLVSPHLFDQLPELLTTDLSHNNLSMLSPLTFHNNQRLQKVDLNGNQLLCTCSLAWLAKQIAHNSSVYSHDLECLSNLHRHRLRDEAENLTDMCHEIPAVNASDIQHLVIGLSARLQCEFEPNPHTVVIWTTPRHRSLTYHAMHPSSTAHLLTEQDTLLNSSYHSQHYWHNSSSYYASLASYRDRILLLNDGSLYIDYVLRSDNGLYKCLVLNANYNSSAQILVRLDYSVLYNVKIMSIVVGLAAAFSFLVLIIVLSIISAIARRLVNKRRREAIRKLLENIDAYKTSQFSRLRENYSGQLIRIRDHYHNQFHRLGDNYHSQMKRVRRGCSHQVERIRDNYTIQVGRLRNYSSHQIEQIREMYNNQLLKIRDYGSLQMMRIHEKYKLQQQHVIKLLETMNLDNCKTVIETECLRTESMIFDVDILKDAETPLSPLSGSDSEYMTATSSENSSQNSLRLTPSPDSQDGELDFNTQELTPGLLDGLDVDYNPVPFVIDLNAEDIGLHESIV